MLAVETLIFVGEQDKTCSSGGLLSIDQHFGLFCIGAP